MGHTEEIKLKLSEAKENGNIMIQNIWEATFLRGNLKEVLREGSLQQQKLTSGNKILK